MSEEIRKSVYRLVELQFGVKNVKDTERLVEDLGAESADVANLVAAVEEKFSIVLKESEIARILTLQDLNTLIQKKLNGS